MDTMIEYVSNYYSPREAWQHLTSRFKRKAETAPDAEVLQPVSTWSPRTELERTVFAALILAGEPVNNRRLAELMRVSPSQASKRVAQLDGVIRKERQGRQVLLALPNH
jgi:hypothetical protein